MPRFRFTVRRMMVAVAIAAFMLAGGELLRRRNAYLEKAENFRHDIVPPSGWDMGGGTLSEEEFRKQLAAFQAEGEAIRRTPRSRHYQAMARKYERAARYPWLPVAPDPPEPK